MTSSRSRNRTYHILSLRATGCCRGATHHRCTPRASWTTPWHRKCGSQNYVATIPFGEDPLVYAAETASLTFRSWSRRVSTSAATVSSSSCLKRRPPRDHSLQANTILRSLPNQSHLSARPLPPADSESLFRSLGTTRRCDSVPHSPNNARGDDQYKGGTWNRCSAPRCPQTRPAPSSASSMPTPWPTSSR